jgi:hypothetical protein
MYFSFKMGIHVSMTTYILLRQNKESKPMSLEDLVNTGLKADDLIWVEGQSACWLRPGEIKQLKDLVGSPAVQPVKVAEAIPVSQPLPLKAETNVPAFQETKITEEVTEHTDTKDTKRVFVAMPAVKKNIEVRKEDTPDYYQSYLPKEEPVPVLKKIVPVGDEEDMIIPETRYSKPLDEIKEMYVKNLERQKKGRNRAIVIPPQIRKASVYAGLILVGLLAGIIIRNSGAKKNTLASNSVPQDQKNSQTPVKQIQDTATHTAPLQGTEPGFDNTREEQQPVTREDKPQPGKFIAQDENKSLADKQERVNDPQPDDITLQAKNNDRNSERRTDARSIAIDEISSKISLKSNDYIVGSFGGIRNLEITLRNDSKYTLDHVTVELQYLKPRDEVLRTENIYFQSIPPNASQTLPVKKSARGIKVAYKVVKIESKEINASTAGL